MADAKTSAAGLVAALPMLAKIVLGFMGIEGGLVEMTCNALTALGVAVLGWQARDKTAKA